MRAIRAEEDWARRVCEAELGVPVTLHDDGSRDGMYDLSAVLGDGRTAAIEVTLVVDEKTIGFWRTYAENRWIVPDLVGGWAVRATPGTRQLRSTLPPFLRALEGAGLKSFRSDRADPELERLAPRGIVTARQSGTSFRGSVYVAPHEPTDRLAGFSAATGDALAEWVGPFLHDERRADVRRKLGQSGASERHVFIVASALSGLEFAVTDVLTRDDAPMPTISPDLPTEVTDIWIASSWDIGVGYRWSVERPAWTTFTKNV